MQHYVIHLIGDCAQYVLFRAAGVIEQGQCLVAVTGEHHPIKALYPTIGHANFGAVLQTAYPFDLGTGMYVAGKRVTERLQILS
jgi:hypothetical protein